MQVRGRISHLRGALERPRGLRKITCAELGATKAGPRRGSVELNRRLPQPRSGVGMAESGEEGGLLLRPGPPEFWTDATADMVQDPHPDDGTAPFRIEAQNPAESLEGRVVRMLHLRD